MRFRLLTDIPLWLRYRLFLPLAGLLFAGAVLIIIRSYLRHKGGLNRCSALSLIMLRVFALIVLFLSILKPVIGGITSSEQLGRIALFIDNSRSMEVRDTIGYKSRLDAVEWYLFGESAMRKRLSRYFTVEEFSFGKGVSRLKKGMGDIQAASDSTNLGGVVSTINELRKSELLLAAIILSDGANNIGSDEKISGERLSAPVFCVGIGKEEGVQSRVDIGVSEIINKKVIVQKTKSPVNFIVSKTGVPKREIRAAITDEDNAVVAEKMITLPDGNGEYNYTIEMIPDKKGIHRYKLSAPILEGETITANNSRYFTVNVIDPELSVLYYEGRPRYELKFIRRTLEESPNVHLYSIVRTREDYYYVQGSTPEIPLNEGFPSTYEELKQFNVLILGTGGTTVLKKDDLTNIVRFVEDGKGLIILGSDDLASFAGSDVEKLIPLRLAQGRTTDNFKLELTQEGRSHPILAGYDDTFNSNPQLSEFSGRVLTGTAKPGTIVLAKSGIMPVIAVQNYGKGRVMLITADNTWQWYMNCRKLGYDSLYEKFWLQSVQWAAGYEATEKEKKFPVIFYAEKDYCNLDEPVKFELQTTEDIKNVRVTLRHDGIEKGVIKLEKAKEENNIYTSVLTFDEMGEHEIAVSYQGETRSVRIVAGDKLREILDTRLNSDLLKRIAYSSGGKYFDISARSSLIDSLRALVVKRRESEEELGIWDTPYPFAAFVLLMSAEWFLRRWKQLV